MLKLTIYIDIIYSTSFPLLIMNSIMKHDYNRASYDSQDNKKSPMNLNNIEITSPISPGLYNHEKNKHTIQQLYRNQLDQLLS